MSERPVRIAVVADIHQGDDRGTKMSSDAMHRLAQFKGFVAYEEPDAVVDLGDRVMATDAAKDRQHLADVAAVFAKMEAPIHHICGNHDVAHLSVAENEAALGQSLASEVVDYGGWRLVLWRANTRPENGFSLSADDLAWLAETLNAADRPTVLMSHIPVSGSRMAGNYHFFQSDAGSTYNEAAVVREMLLGVTVPLMVLSGHVHWNSLTFLSGQPHLTLQSLTESFTTAPLSAGAYGMLTLTGSTIAWRVFGEDPFAAEFSTEATARRWLTPQKV